MSEIDVIIGNLNASVAELEKAMARAESAGLSSENVATMEAMIAQIREEIDKMYDLAMERGLPEAVTVKRIRLKDD
jgi:2-hydroxychromene-2-carboxylate isomerase